MKSCDNHRKQKRGQKSSATKRLGAWWAMPTRQEAGQKTARAASATFPNDARARMKAQ
jgi:hypothetical protein